MTEAAVPPTDLKDTLEEMRASVAGEVVRARLDAMVQKAILRLLEVILALLADYRAWKLARVGVVEAAVDRAAAAPSRMSSGSGCAGDADRAVAYPSPSRSPGSSPGAGPSLSRKGRGMMMGVYVGGLRS